MEAGRLPAKQLRYLTPDQFLPICWGRTPGSLPIPWLVHVIELSFGAEFVWSVCKINFSNLYLFCLKSTLPIFMFLCRVFVWVFWRSWTAHLTLLYSPSLNNTSWDMWTLPACWSSPYPCHKTVDSSVILRVSGLQWAAKNQLCRQSMC